MGWSDQVPGGEGEGVDVLTWSQGDICSDLVPGGGRCSDLVMGAGRGVDVLTWSGGEGRGKGVDVLTLVPGGEGVDILTWSQGGGWLTMLEWTPPPGTILPWTLHIQMPVNLTFLTLLCKNVEIGSIGNTPCQTC